MRTPIFKFLVFYLLFNVCIQENVKAKGFVKSIQSALSRPLSYRKNLNPKPNVQKVFFQLPKQNTGQSLKCNPSFFNLEKKRYQTEFKKMGLQFQFLLKTAIEQTTPLQPELLGFEDLLQRPIKDLMPSDFLSNSFLTNFMKLIPASTSSMTFNIPIRLAQLKTEFNEARLRFQKVLELSKKGELQTPDGKALLSKNGMYTIQYEPIVELKAIEKMKSQLNPRRQRKELEAWTTFYEMAQFLVEIQKYYYLLDAFQMLIHHCSLAPIHVSNMKQQFKIPLITTKDQSKLLCPTKTDLTKLKEGVYLALAKESTPIDTVLMVYNKQKHGNPHLKESILVSSETLEPAFSNIILDGFKLLIPKQETDLLTYLDTLLPKLQQRNPLVENFVDGFFQVNAKKALQTQGYQRRSRELSFFFSQDNNLIVDVDFIFDISKVEEVVTKYQKLSTNHAIQPIFESLLKVLNAIKAHNAIQSLNVKFIFYKKLEQFCYPVIPSAQTKSKPKTKLNFFSRTKDLTNLPQKEGKKSINTFKMSLV